MPPELELIVSPRATYARLVREPVRVSAIAALRRPLLVAVVIGVSVSIVATGRATPALVLGTTLSWSYVVLVQLAIALLLIAPRAGRRVGLARAIDLFFAGHAPWSLLLLIVAAWGPSPVGWPLWPMAAPAAAALLLTPRIVTAFFGEVFGMRAREARRAAIVQQAMTWTVTVAIFWVTSALTPRLFEVLGLT